MSGTTDFSDILNQTKDVVNQANQTKDSVNNARSGKLPSDIQREQELNRLRTTAYQALGVLKFNAQQLIDFLKAEKQATYPSYFANAIAIWRYVYRLSQQGTSPANRNLVNADTRAAINAAANWLIAEPATGGIPGLLSLNLAALKAGDEAAPAPGSEGSVPDTSGSTSSGSNTMLMVLGGVVLLGGILLAVFKGSGKKALSGTTEPSPTPQLAGASKVNTKKTITVNIL